MFIHICVTMMDVLGCRILWGGGARHPDGVTLPGYHRLDLSWRCLRITDPPVQVTGTGEPR